MAAQASHSYSKSSATGGRATKSHRRILRRQRPRCIPNNAVRIIGGMVVMCLCMSFYFGVKIHGDGVPMKLHGLMLSHDGHDHDGDAKVDAPQKTIHQHQADAPITTAAAASSFDPRKYLQATRGQPVLPITAYVEPPQPISRPFPPNARNGTQRTFDRSHARAQDLKVYEYKRRREQCTCSELQTSFPVDHTQDLDDKYGMLGSKFATPLLYDARHEYAACCSPIDLDPWLPWIHDAFVAGPFVEFIAQNRRRCRTHPKHSMVDMIHLEPQVALLQSVPVKKIVTTNDNDLDGPSIRYGLSTLEDADEDGRETRFICKFHRLKPSTSDGASTETLGETLSVYPYNYEHAHARKPGKVGMLTYPDDPLSDGTAHNDHIWNSNLHFRCPIPDSVQGLLGASVIDGIPSIYVDVVPIRTPARLHKSGYFPQDTLPHSFDPVTEWAFDWNIPKIEDSGRWANIPLCPVRSAAPSSSAAETASTVRAARTTALGKTSQVDENSKKRYTLVGCVWASSTFQTRGNENVDESNAERLLEWLTFQLHIAKFDHIYIYDNSMEPDIQANNGTDTLSLKDVIDRFSKSQVTRIHWPHRICNNNRPMHPNPGERSSQYAAEASCRVRYGHTTTWMSFLDIDEYFIPHSRWKDLKDYLQHGVASRTQILSFFQTRAKPNRNLMHAYQGSHEHDHCDSKRDDCQGLAKDPTLTFLETYNCDTAQLPKPQYGWRAKKQIYRPEFLLNHFVHYSTVTRNLLNHPDGKMPNFVQPSPFERRVDELRDAFLLHAKTTHPRATFGWEQNCDAEGLGKKKCPVGIPYGGSSTSTIPEGTPLTYNCFPHDRVKELIPVLESAMTPYKR